MKKLTTMIIVLGLMLSFLSSCSKGTYEDGYNKGLEDGYVEGFDVGYNEGIVEAQQYIAFVVDDDLWWLALDTKKEYGLYPEDALLILSNYADVPDEVTETELYQAIWAIYRYYYKAQEIINGIEDYQID